MRVKCSNWEACLYGTSETPGLESKGYTCTPMTGRDNPGEELGHRIRCDAVKWLGLDEAFLIEEVHDVGG
jgi:hypothetical protein